MNRPLCNHENMRTVFRILENGTEQWGTQCLGCGQWRAVRKASLAGRPAFEFEQSIQSEWFVKLDEYYEKQRQASLAGYQSKQEEWFKEHEAYLQTDAWQAKRQAVLLRAQGICEGCRQAPATIVHHLSYKHWKDELLFELAAVCSGCHDRAHSDKNT